MQERPHRANRGQGPKHIQGATRQRVQEGQGRLTEKGTEKGTRRENAEMQKCKNRKYIWLFFPPLKFSFFFSLKRVFFTLLKLKDIFFLFFLRRFDKKLRSSPKIFLGSRVLRNFFLVDSLCLQ